MVAATALTLTGMTLPGQAGEPVTPHPGDPGELDRAAVRGIPSEEIAAAATIFKVLGTFGDAYLSRLGQMLAESTPAILKRIRLRRYPVHDTGRLTSPTTRLHGATLRWDAARGQRHEA